MKFILIEVGISIGGIEILMSDFALYLANKNIDVLFVIPDKRNIIHEKLIGEDNPHIKFCRVKGLGGTIYYDPNDKVFADDRKIIFKYINQNERIYVVTCFFYTLQYAMNIFKGYAENTRMLQIWSHPLEWIHRIVHNNNYIYKKRKNSLYYYQKELLQILTNNQSSYFISKSIFDFNNWYYETSLIPPENMWCAPVRFLKRNSLEQFPVRKVKDKLNVLWVGRLTYFKNDAIIYIFNTLENLSNKYSNIEIIFNIVGDGLEKDRNYIKSKIVAKNVSVNFFGTVAPDKLYEVFDANDIGIAMGLTVKIMAANGLPSILIDSLDKKYKSTQNCNWIFDIDEGDAGDGLYYHIMGTPLKYRKDLYELLDDVINGNIDLNEYGMKGKRFVEENYAYEKKYNDFYNAALNSTFSPNMCKTFHYNRIIRLVYRMYIYIRSVVKNDNKF